MTAAKSNKAKPPLAAQQLEQLEQLEIPDTLPIMPVSNFVLFPFMIAPVAVTLESSKKLIEEAIVGTRIIGVVTRKKPVTEEIKLAEVEEKIHKVGVAAIILRMLRVPDGSMRILIHGLSRIVLSEFLTDQPYMKARIEAISEPEDVDKETEAMMRNAKDLLNKAISISPLPDDLGIAALNIKEPGKLADLIASNLPLKVEELQQVLETLNPKERLQQILVILNRELEMMELTSKIQSEVKTEIDKSQREYFLRQQLKAIKKELGEEEGPGAEIQELKKKVESTPMPDYARETAEHEIKRLEAMHPSSAEYTVSRTYLDWILALPWEKSTADNIDVNVAQQVLDEDHYDLDKVKERIVEYLAVIKLKGNLKGPILCFVGPPGVGKTSLGKSIARALGRKFYRMSLGGMRDEAEIRGHRRTYIGALPGRIIKGVKECGSNNPVMMLDEVDKIGVDFRGDPSSALLEVLDPEQNSTFTDNYLDMAFDLSKVMFITTANILDTIPPALLDRMEVLRLPGYSLKEKLAIAKKYLVPRELENNGLKSEEVKFADPAIEGIIEEYTREAGLRNVQREIANICRKIARRRAEGDKSPVEITRKQLAEFLGPPKFYSELAQRMQEPGVAVGLAWTQTGGEILFIEASSTEGTGKLLLTGQLGEVMKESAQAALTYLHSQAPDLQIAEELFSKRNIHVHIPAGAIPKDGPSAGIAIGTALASLLTQRRVKDFVGMTGEVTLKGNVLPIGGVKEKILAAHRGGIKEVILPQRNKKDLVDIPPEIKKKIKFHFVNRMDEVLELALHNKKD